VNLFDAIGCATHVAAVNSTVLYESMLAGKPTLSMGEGLFTGRDFLYEVRSTEHTHAVAEWLALEGLSGRIRRFERFCAYLLRRAVYAYGFPGEEGYRGLRARDLARRIARCATKGVEGVSALSDPEALDWILRLATEWPVREEELRAEAEQQIAEFGSAGQLVLRMRRTQSWALARAMVKRIAALAGRPGSAGRDG
jgi:hypothetical protein